MISIGSIQLEWICLHCKDYRNDYAIVIFDKHLNYLKLLLNIYLIDEIKYIRYLYFEHLMEILTGLMEISK